MVDRSRLGLLTRQDHRSDAARGKPAEGDAFDDYASGTSGHAEQALCRLAGRLRERRGVASG